jgi:RimJ/RimL family protein N-acetyltransferase
MMESADVIAVDSLSLGWQTDLIFARFDGEVHDRGGHLLVRTPGNPTFWWGNFLLFRRAPCNADLPAWMNAFEEEIAAVQPESRHRAFGLDVEERVTLPADFKAAGFELNEATVLTLTGARLRPARRPVDGDERFAVLHLPDDARALGDQQCAVDADRYDDLVAHRVFVDRQLARYARMQDAGLGHWFGLYEKTDAAPVLAATCGLFRDPHRADGLGRFQYVSTHPAWRRRGLCSALVHAVCRFGFETMGLRTLVMVADPNDVAIGIYESLGFERGVSTWQLERRPR